MVVIGLDRDRAVRELARLAPASEAPDGAPSTGRATVEIRAGGRRRRDRRGARVTVGPHRVLVVAKGYPSFDIPGRGSFVADHVAALRAAGAEVVVASFETVQIAGRDAERDRRVAAAEAVWAELVAEPAALTAGQRWGAPGVPVARLPVVRTWGPTDGSEAPSRPTGTPPCSWRSVVRWPERADAADRPFTVIHAHTGLPTASPRWRSPRARPAPRRDRARFAAPAAAARIPRRPPPTGACSTARRCWP